MLLFRLIFVLFILGAMGWTVFSVGNQLITEEPLSSAEMFLAGVASTCWLSVLLLNKKKKK